MQAMTPANVKDLDAKEELMEYNSKRYYSKYQLEASYRILLSVSSSKNVQHKRS
jgi:hypothetical protein